uniref:Uncharacterized protein n=1 Tax=Plectus sambesii TaxID=2011161 RepID=A0A914X276_9BILA
MQEKIFMLAIVSLCFCSIHSTTVQFHNRCGYRVQVIRTANGQQPALECSLGSGGSCSRGYNSNGMNFKNGWGGKTLAEFTFHTWKNLDFYDLSVIVGYDTPMRISSSTGGPTVTCTSRGCPDAYQFPADNIKNHGTRAGGTFKVDFCP